MDKIHVLAAFNSSQLPAWMNNTNVVLGIALVVVVLVVGYLFYITMIRPHPWRDEEEGKNKSLDDGGPRGPEDDEDFWPRKK